MVKNHKIVIDKNTVEMLMLIKVNRNFRTYDDVIRFLLDRYQLGR